MGEPRQTEQVPVTSRLRLAPQMAEYDKLGALSVPRPYVMFSGAPNYRSSVVNTDKQGMRHSCMRAEGDYGIIVGASAAFGVGASADVHALGPLLFLNTNIPWLNFAGRAFTSAQELILFQSIKLPRSLGKLREIVIFSGFNDLFLYHYASNFDPTFGAFFFSDSYRLFAPPVPQGWRRKLFKRLAYPILGETPDYVSGAFPGLLWPSSRDERKQQAKPDRQVVTDIFARNMQLWKLFAADLGAKLTFVLQPVATWMGKRLTPEEAEIFAELDRELLWQRGIASMTPATGAWLRANLAIVCRELSIAWLDMNSILADRTDWLFVDRVHLNDAGYLACAEAIARVLK